ncbi:UNVERIFIED_CONTAM: Gad1 [Trichonephila clavipes]
MLKKLKEKKDRFHLILEEPECTNVSFWYIPKRLRNVPHSPEKEKVLGELTAKLKGRMMNAGTLMIGYQPQGDIPNFFRSIISNAAVQEYDIDFMLDELERLGHDL